MHGEGSGDGERGSEGRGPKVADGGERRMEGKVRMYVLVGFLVRIVKFH